MRAKNVLPALLVALFVGVSAAYGGGVGQIEAVCRQVLESLGVTSAGSYAAKQPLDADLTTLAAVTVTAAGTALLDDATAAAQCTTLGLGTGNSPTFTAVQIGSADTSGARLEINSGILDVREGDDSGAAQIRGGVVSSAPGDGTDRIRLDAANSAVSLGSAQGIRWGPATNAPTTSWDVTLTRLGAGQLSIGGAQGQATNVNCVTTSSGALSGATVTLSNARPAGSIIVGVTVRVTTTITGATSFSIGDGSDADRYGASIALTSGTTTTLASHTASPIEWLSAAGNIVLTANGSNFSGGVVRISVHYLDLTPPGS